MVNDRCHITDLPQQSCIRGCLLHSLPESKRSGTVEIIKSENSDFASPLERRLEAQYHSSALESDQDGGMRRTSKRVDGTGSQVDPVFSSMKQNEFNSRRSANSTPLPSWERDILWSPTAQNQIFGGTDQFPLTSFPMENPRSTVIHRCGTFSSGSQLYSDGPTCFQACSPDSDVDKIFRWDVIRPYTPPSECVRLLRPSRGLDEWGEAIHFLSDVPTSSEASHTSAPSSIW